MFIITFKSLVKRIGYRKQEIKFIHFIFILLIIYINFYRKEKINN